MEIISSNVSLSCFSVLETYFRRKSTSDNFDQFPSSCFSALLKEIFSDQAFSIPSLKQEQLVVAVTNTLKIPLLAKKSNIRFTQFGREGIRYSRNSS